MQGVEVMGREKYGVRLAQAGRELWALVEPELNAMSAVLGR